MEFFRDARGELHSLFLVLTDSALARVLGVSPEAVRKAAEDGRITRAPGGWDVLEALKQWRERTYSGYVPGRPLCLDYEVPVTPAMLRELRARARREAHGR